MSHPHSGSEPRTLAQLLCEADGGFAQHPDGTPLRTAPCERHVWMAEWLEARGVRVGTPEVSEEAVRGFWKRADHYGLRDFLRAQWNDSDPNAHGKTKDEYADESVRIWLRAAWAAQFGRGRT